MLTENLRKVEHVLQKLGLVQSEIQVFFAGLERGAATVKQLATDTHMNRITVHEIIKRLIKKGLFLQSYSGKKRLVYPNQMDALPQLIQQRKHEIQQLEQEAQQAASILQSIQLQSEVFPKTRIYKGKEGVQIVINEIKQDKRHAALMSDGQHFYDLIDNDFLEKSLDYRNRYKLHIRMMFPVGFEYFSYMQGTYQQQLDIKALPEHLPFKGGITLWGEKVSFHCYEGRFITTTILENRHISSIMKVLFEHVRSTARAY